MAKDRKKSYVVLGLGSFGTSTAIELEKQGIEVMAIDANKERVEAVTPYVTCPIQLDVTNESGLSNLGIKNMDGAIVSIGENLEASVMATILIKEMGVPMIYAKAENSLQKKILLKVGADRVIFPEKESGERIATIIAGNFSDYFHLSDKVSIVEVTAKKEWVGKNLVELDFRNRYQVNVIALKRNGEVLFVDGKTAIEANDDIIAAGENHYLENL